MERRLLLAGVAAAGVAIGTPGIATAAPRRSRPLLAYGQEGGFVPAGWDALRAPRLVIYADRTAIVDAERRLRLGPVDRLVRQAVAVVSDPRNDDLTLGPDDPQVADAPHTWFAAGGKRLSAYALEMYREFGGYPAATYALYDALERVTARVRERGEAYRPDAVKLCAVPVEPDPQAPVAPWPDGVRVPAAGENQVVEHRYGAAARAVARRIPASGWHLFRVPSGRVLIVSYRRLLPHERTA